MRRMFVDLNLIYKITIPVVFLLLTVALVLLTAQSGFDSLRRDTHHMIGDIVARRIILLTAVADVNDAAIQEKTELETTDEGESSRYLDRYQAKLKSALAGADELVAGAPTPEKRAASEAFRAALLDYKRLADQSMALNRRGEHENAIRLSKREVLDARRKTCWRSTRASRRHAPATLDAASRSWPRRCVRWRSGLLAPPRRSSS